MRIVTWNIRHGWTSTGRVDLDDLAAACVGFGADVLAIQELDRRRLRSRLADEVKLIAEATGLTPMFACTRRWVWVEYGHALFVRGSVQSVETIRLPRVARNERRAAIVASATVDDERLSIAATHLSVRRAESSMQLQAALDNLTARAHPRLLLGDLNLEPERCAVAIAAAGLELVAARPTFPASAPTRQIDHIAVGGVRVTNVEVRQQPLSDHLALVADATVTRR